MRPLKNALLTIVILVLFQACASVRKVDGLNASAENQAAEPITAPVLSSNVNAAQISGDQLLDAGQKFGLHSRKNNAVRPLHAIRKSPVLPRDSAQLYERRKPVDLRITNRTGLASFWLAMGSLGSFIIGSAVDNNSTGGQATASGVLGLAGLLAGIAAFVTAIVGTVEFHRNPEKFKGRGYAIVGISWGIFIVIGLILLFLIILAFSSI
jgi:hypothetical protein